MLGERNTPLWSWRLHSHGLELAKSEYERLCQSAALFLIDLDTSDANCANCKSAGIEVPESGPVVSMLGYQTSSNTVALAVNETLVRLWAVFGA